MVLNSLLVVHGGKKMHKSIPLSQGSPDIKYLSQGSPDIISFAGRNIWEVMLYSAKPSRLLGTSGWRTLCWTYKTIGHISLCE